MQARATPAGGLGTHDGAIRVVRYTIYHSPNAYLGTVLAERCLRGLPVVVERRPIFIPRERGVYVADLVGGRESAVHTAYNREDCRRWSDRYGIPLVFPPPDWFAQRSIEWRRSTFHREELPARAYYAAVGSGREETLDRELFEAAWVRGLDVNVESTVAECAERAGLEPEGLLQRLRGDDVERVARRALGDFEAHGCPGVPTWVVGGQRYWGKDRVEFLAHAIRQRVESGPAAMAGEPPC